MLPPMPQPDLLPASPGGNFVSLLSSHTHDGQSHRHDGQDCENLHHMPFIFLVGINPLRFPFSAFFAYLRASR